MPSSLSVDLRERVIKAIDEGMRKNTAANVFKVSRRAIYKWLDLRNETKSLSPRSGYQKGHNPKIQDLDKFKAFVEKNKHCTVEKMILVWKDLTGVSISGPIMGKYLKRIGYSFKKKRSDTLKQAPKSVHYFWTN
jgi:transposase